MLFLSPFFDSGFIAAYFGLAGNIPDEGDLLQLWIIGELKIGELIFNILTEISS